MQSRGDTPQCEESDAGERVQVTQSSKLSGVAYDVRGPVLDEAMRLEQEGHRILRLNIGNPAPFGFDAPEEIVRDMVRQLPTAQGYSDSRGIVPARRAVVQYHEAKGIEGIDVDDVWLGNGVSELITMACQALLEDGDEVLVPAPDYPLWSAVVSLCGGRAVHYVCDEGSGWLPDPADVEAKVTDRTRALVIINPNNPTGAVYPADVLDALVVTFNGLSKAYRVAGFRAGWMLVSGPTQHAGSYLEGLSVLANMRLCPNVPAQHGIQAALGGPRDIRELVLPGGRLVEQRDIAHRMLNEIPGVSCVKARGALYAFPRLDPAVYRIDDDERFVLELLRSEHVMLVHGRGFNWPRPDHLRIVTLPHAEDLADAIGRLGSFLERWSS
jgi:alanine-synthesizing transaminase